jgi:uncharacterized membrane protein
MLRLHGLGTQSLWHDEVLTARSVQVPFSQVVQTVDHTENTPPGYFILLNPWSHLFGDSEACLRFPSALFSLAAIPMMYLVARRWFQSIDAGLAAALLLALSRFQIAYAQEARGYSLMMLLALVSCHAYALVVSEERRWKYAVIPLLYILSSAGILWVHPYGGFVLIAQAIHFQVLLLMKRRTGLAPAIGWRLWLATQVAIALLFRPWLESMKRVWGAGEPWLVRPHLGQTLLAYADTLPLLLVLLCLAALGTWFGIRRRRAHAVLFALLVMILPVAVPILLSQGKRSIFVARYGMTMQIGLYLLAGYGASSLGRRAAALMLATICLLALPNVTADFRAGLNVQRKAAVRDAAAYIAATASPGDGLLCTEFNLSRVIRYYWPRRDLADVPALTQDAPSRVWLVFHEPRFVGSTQSEEQLLASYTAESRYQASRQQAFPGLVVVELQRLNPEDRSRVSTADAKAIIVTRTSTTQRAIEP